jgi:hypothetical protein
MVDTSTGTQTWRRGLAYESPPHKPSLWARNDGTLAKLELKRAQQMMADRIVEEVYLQPDLSIWFGAPGRPRACSIMPVRPKPEWERSLYDDTSVETATVDSLTPSLAWESPKSVPASITSSEPQDYRYDLRIWEDYAGAPGALIYERDGLTRPEHVVETPLVPRVKYYWSVRMRYVVDGAWRATRWSASNVPPLVSSAASWQLLLSADVEENSAKAQRCLRLQSRSLSRLSTVGPVAPPSADEAYMTCSCLDFIPSENYYSFRTP